jgi:hypothetical protein
VLAARITRPLNRMSVSVNDFDFDISLVHICVSCVLPSFRSYLTPSVQVSAPALSEDKDENEKHDEEGNVIKCDEVNKAKRVLRSYSVTADSGYGHGNGHGHGDGNAEVNVSSGCIGKGYQRNRSRDRAQHRQISQYLHSCPSFCSNIAPVPIPASISIPPVDVTVTVTVPSASAATRATSERQSDHSSDACTFPSSSSKSIDNCSEHPRSCADIASLITSFNSEFVVATAYNEGLQKVFGNVSALEVAVSLTRNAEIESRSHMKVRHLGVSELSEEERTDNDLLSALPAFNYSKSCTRIIQSLEKSARKEEEFLFFLRVKSVIDENGFSLSGWQTLLTLEGIRELSTDAPDIAPF